MKQPVWKAILTDGHFWLPVAVLVIGISVLMAVR
ncbi:MAG: translocated intimin receptor Tir [Acidobacteria bacterium]|nr:translocated intimin receptor Tir [Acidobacteriota bacterium]